jgi:subtilisin family serine protease
MRTRRRRSLVAAGCLLALATALSLAASSLGVEDDPAQAEHWRSAFGARPEIDLGGRVIVVLAAPSLADRAGEDGTLPSPRAQRRLVRKAERFQRRLIVTLRAQGVVIRRERSYTKTFNGFSAVLDARALAALERAPGVVGVYPVRAVYPATLTGNAILRPVLGDASGHRSAIELPGRTGAGITIALLDTGVDRSHPALRGRVAPGIDLVASSHSARVEESHGTRMAGIIVGREPLDGVAPGATVLPIRVLGQHTGSGGVAYAGRSDVLLEGLERAVDPDGDGDVEDAADVALAALVEPYASFADTPEARSVAGALRLGTLVVAAAGNDGPGASGSGTVGAPAGAPAALAVGAIDTRAQVLSARITVSVAGEEIHAGSARLLGPVEPAEGTTLAGSDIAVLAADGSALVPRLREATSGGARAAFVFGSGLPGGALDLEEATAVPTLAIPLETGEELLAARESGAAVTVTVGEVTTAANADAGLVAPFSSEGPAVGGAPKPDLVAPGVGLVTADRSGDGGASFATVTGSSAAAAVVAGAAALVAEARPRLDAAALRSVLVGSASLRSESAGTAAAQGAGLVDPAGAAAAALSIEPAALAVALPGAGEQSTLVLRNLSSRPLRVDLALDPATSPGLTLVATPARLNLRAGATGQAEVAVAGAARSGTVGSATIVASARGVELARIPLLLTGPRPRARLVEIVELSSAAFTPSDSAPAVLAFRAGQAESRGAGVAVTPVALLEVELLNARGKRVGVLARLRDLLPGQYALGLTGRGPNGAKLAPGRYTVRLRAHGVATAEGLADKASTDAVSFRIVRR